MYYFCSNSVLLIILYYNLTLTEMKYQQREEIRIKLLNLQIIENITTRLDYIIVTLKKTLYTKQYFQLTREVVLT